MSGLEVPVSAPGLNQTTQGFNALDKAAMGAAKGMTTAATAAEQKARALKVVADRVKAYREAQDKANTSVAKASANTDVLLQRMRSGEVVRNMASTMTLLAVTGGDATDKIAGVAGALAAVPGPVGMAASAVAAAAVAIGLLSKEAKRAADAVANTKKELDALGNARIEGLQQLASKITAAALSLGPNLRKSIAAGADTSLGAALRPGDAKGALEVSTAIANENLSGAATGQLMEVLEQMRSMGEDITASVVKRAAQEVRYNAEAMAPISSEEAERLARSREESGMRGGGMFAGGINFAPRERVDLRGTVLDTMGRDSSNNSQMNDAYSRSRSGLGRGWDAALRAAEAPAIAESNAAYRTAVSGSADTRTMEGEALKVSTDKNTTATKDLTKGIVKLEETIKTTQARLQGEKAEAYTGWRSWFNGRQESYEP